MTNPLEPSNFYVDLNLHCINWALAASSPLSELDITKLSTVSNSFI